MFELFSNKKRDAAIWRLHNSNEVINKKYVIQIPKPNSDYTDTAKLLRSYGANEICYCISINKNIDGKFLSLDEALENAIGFGLGSLISCNPGRLAYLEEEQEMGPPRRFILKKD